MMPSDSVKQEILALNAESERDADLVVALKILAIVGPRKDHARRALRIAEELVDAIESMRRPSGSARV